MELLTFYVGQGACAVLRNDDEAIIIDAIFPSQNDSVAIFLKRVLPKALRGRKLSGVMLTSFDKDHADARAVRWILNRYVPEWVMFPAYWHGSQNAQEVLDAIEATGTRRFDTCHELYSKAVRLDRMGSRFVTDLSRNFDFEVFSPHPDDYSSSNNCSLVTRITAKNGSGFSYLVTGDTEVARWHSICRYFGHRLNSDVMAAPHHGSRSGIHEDALACVNPFTVLISCGVDNQHDHPHVEALEAFISVEADVYCTGYKGVSFRTWKPARGAVRTEVLDF